MAICRYLGNRVCRPRSDRFILITILLCVSCYIFLRRRYSLVYKTHPFSLLAAGTCFPEGSKVLSADNNACCPNVRQLPMSRIDVHSAPNYSEISSAHPDLCGGSWKPQNCQSQQNVAILIPYRDREVHLRLLLYRLHDVLPHQRIAYTIYVIEQAGTTPFNRGLLLNIGMRESLIRDPTIDCFVFHDVDLLPEISDNLYLCDKNLRHLASGINEFRFHPPFANYAGGVTTLSKTNAQTINGFPNRYWGWGNEDDELAARCFAHGLKLTRSPKHIGRYRAVRHVKSSRGTGHYETFRAFRGFFNDGLNYLSNNSYRILFDSSVATAQKPYPKSHVALPFQLQGCALRSVASYLGIPTKNITYTPSSNQADSADVRLLVDKALRFNTYRHIIIDPTGIYNTTIRPAKVTEENLLWFLHFYGWI